ncbi:MAG TPA: hypothetical protein VF595_12415 [Tepidisphaeraceae bacterium]
MEAELGDGRVQSYSDFEAGRGGNGVTALQPADAQQIMSVRIIGVAVDRRLVELFGRGQIAGLVSGKTAVDEVRVWGWGHIRASTTPTRQAEGRPAALRVTKKVREQN